MELYLREASQTPEPKEIKDLLPSCHQGPRRQGSLEADYSSEYMVFYAPDCHLPTYPSTTDTRPWYLRIRKMRNMMK